MFVCAFSDTQPLTSQGHRCRLNLFRLTQNDCISFKIPEKGASGDIETTKRTKDKFHNDAFQKTTETEQPVHRRSIDRITRLKHLKAMSHFYPNGAKKLHRQVLDSSALIGDCFVKCAIDLGRMAGRQQQFIFASFRIKLFR